MKENCIDEGTIQAFLDGELSADLLENVACHFALCDDCSLLLQEAEGESAFAFSVLDDELNSLVPTERIRTNLYQAISTLEKPKTSWMQKIFAGFSLANPSMVAFASLLIVVGIFAAVFGLRKDDIQSKPDEVVNAPTPIVETVAKDTGEEIAKTFDDPKPTRVKPEARNNAQTIAFKPQTKNQKFVVQDLGYRTENPKSKIQNPKSDSLPIVKPALLDGEDTYLKTIATLENSVKDKKDNTLKVSSRISFERDMAVVEDSIKRMKAEVRKNPKNDAAKQILRNSYQNKIDLLNSITERSEFMASLD